MILNTNKFVIGNKYSIYQLYNEKQIRYFIYLANEEEKTNDLYVAFPTKEINYLSKDELIKEIDKLGRLVIGVNKGAVCIIPDIEIKELIDASKENDNHSYQPILAKLHSIIFDVNKKLRDEGHQVKQIINLIKQTNEDTKFIQWIESSNIGNFFRSIYFSKLNEIYTDKVNDDESIGPTNIQGNTQNATLSNSNPKVKVKISPTSHHGFSSFSFIVLVLMMSIVFGVSIGYILINL